MTPHLRRPESRPSRRRWWLVLVTALACIIPLQVPTAAYGDDGPDLNTTNCTGHLECLYFRSGWSNSADPNVPSETTWDIVPVQAEPSDKEGEPWQGTFAIVQHRSTFGTDPDRKCLSTVAIGISVLGSCGEDGPGSNPNQRWYIEPVGAGRPSGYVTDPDAPLAWDAWWHSDTWPPTRLDTKFYLRSAGKGPVAKTCHGSPRDGLVPEDGASWVNPCSLPGDTPPDKYLWNLDAASDAATSNPKTAAEQKKLSAYLMQSALAHAASVCGTDLNTCRARLWDDQTAPPRRLSDWSRVNQLQIDAPPNPVTVSLGCASVDTGGKDGEAAPPPTQAQSIYNGGSEPMGVSLSASATTGTSTSFSNSVAVAVEISIKAIIQESSVTVTNTTTYGKTWNDSQSVSQSVNWVVPPRRFATASLSSSAVRVTAEWEFDSAGANPWHTDRFTQLDVPYSSSSSASGPDTVLAVYNSYQQKACGATTPSVLDPAHLPTVVNSTRPDQSPVVGDRLGVVDAEPQWWLVPDGDGSEVNLRYQWYRQRSTTPPEPIPGAREATYTVTTDDVTDDEILSRVGPYHLFVVVTDIADQYRFDSLDYPSVATGGVFEKAPEEQEPEEPTPPGQTQLHLTVANPDADAGTATIVELTASADGTFVPWSGTLDLRDNGEVIRSGVELAPDGTVRMRARLGRGVHRLDALYGHDTVRSGARSNTVATTVTGAASTTVLRLADDTVPAGQPVLATATVGARRSTEATPTGLVQFYDGEQTLGAPVPLDTSGTASLRLPGLDTVGPHQLRAAYLGDDVFEPSASRPVTQDVARVATTVKIRVKPRVTYRKGRARVLVRVFAATGTGVPPGSVEALVEGRAQGSPVTLDASGRARVTLRGLAAGNRRISVRYLPADPSGAHAGALSAVRRLQVRRYGARVRLDADRHRVRPRQRLRLTGRVTTIGKAPRARGRVQLLLGGRVLKVKRVERDGSFRFGLRGRRLDEGWNNVRVRYVGNRPHSIAPARSHRIEVARRPARSPSGATKGDSAHPAPISDRATPTAKVPQASRGAMRH